MSQETVQRTVDVRFKQLRKKLIKGELGPIEVRLRLRHKMKVATEDAVSRMKKHIDHGIELEASATKEWMDQDDE